MKEHPIEGLMSSAMISIEDMIDVNTIIGDPIQTNNNIVIIPISKVSFGFAAGGSEFNEETIEEYIKKDRDEQVQYKLPFGGGSGAGVCINPVAFLVVQDKVVKILHVNNSSAIDRLLDYVPDLFNKVNSLLNNKTKNSSNDNNDGRIEKDISKMGEILKDYKYEDSKATKKTKTNKTIEEDD